MTDRLRTRTIGLVPGLALTVPVVLAVLVGLVGCGTDGRAGPAPAGDVPGTAAPGTAVPQTTPPFDVQAENARPGDDCGIARLGEDHAVEGWLDRTSIAPGEPLQLFASTNAPELTVSVFRIGWYGGRTCRLVHREGPVRGVRQSAVTREPGTNTVSTQWTPTMSFDTATWPPGAYLLRLDDSNGWQRYVPLTVRTMTANGRIVILNAVTTWQAYNAWGGYSLYRGATGAFADRARVVSFDRPYDFGDGAADFTGNEAPLIILAERLGLPLAYATDIDLHADSHLLDGASAVISLGHDEYYTPQMRQALTAARDHGVNIAFLGANAVYRRIRLTPSPHGEHRVEAGYKVASEDPLFGVDDAQITANWPSPPHPDPESSLTGGMYQCNPVHADLVVNNPGHWLLAGTGTTAGDRIPGLIGPEYDRVDLANPTPELIEVLAHSPVTCRGGPDHADVSYYTASSGAGVFDSGTSAWVCALGDVCGPGAGGDVVRTFTTRVTTTLLEEFARGPAGRTHPGARSVPTDYHNKTGGSGER